MDIKMSNIDNSDFSTYYAYHPHSAEACLPMVVEMAGDEQCSPNYCLCRVNAALSVLIYLLSGEGILEIDHVTHELCQGDLLMIPRGTTYEYRAKRGNPWRILWFNVTGELFPYLLGKYNLLSTLVYPQANGRVLSAFEKGMELCKDNSDRESVQGRLCAIPYEVVLAAWQQYNHEPEYLGVAGQLRQYIDDSISNDQSLPFSPEKAAMQQNLSSRQLERAFKKEYGVTPYQYFQSQKLLLAKQYLRNTNLTIKEISSRLGFCDQYYFSNRFKEEQGVSPKHYR